MPFLDEEVEDGIIKKSHLEDLAEVPDAHCQEGVAFVGDGHCGLVLLMLVHL